MKMTYDTMERLIQDGKPCCGQTCLAMLSGLSIEDVQYTLSIDEGLSLTEMRLACFMLGIPVGKWVKFVKHIKYSNPWYCRDILPPNCIISLQKKVKDSGHLILRIGNVFHDPHRRESSPDILYNGKIKAYLELNIETKKRVRGRRIGLVGPTQKRSISWHVKDRDQIVC